MNLQNRILSLPIFCMAFLLFPFPTSAQLEIIEGHLSSSEKKKLEKADRIELEIADLDRKAEEYNEKGDEEKANSCLLKAHSKWQEANLIRTELFGKKLEQFRREFTGKPGEIATGQMLEDQAHEYFDRCQTLREGAKRITDPGEKIASLSEALRYEKAGIFRQTDALNYYYNWPVDYRLDYSLTDPLADKKTKPGTLNIDSLSTPIETDFTVSENLWLSRSDSLHASDSVPDGYLGVNNFDKKALSRAWYKYIYGPNWETDSVYKTVAGIVNYPAENDSVLLASEASKKPIPGTSKTVAKQFFADKENIRKDSLRTVSYQIPESGVRVITEPVYSNNSKTLPESKNVSSSPVKKIPEANVYRVQIAAGKNPLSQNLLRKVYSGNKEFNVVNEDGWNKYSIGDFSTWEEANKFRMECGVPGAFIVKSGSSTGVGINASTAPSGSEPGSAISSSAIEFRVQIAASRKPMPAEELRRIYKGNRTINSFSEEGWLKYHIASVSSYGEAKQIQAESGTRHAFIVAYRDGKKVELYNAIHPPSTGSPSEITITPSKAPDVGKVYYIQLAASRRSMDKESLLKLIGVPLSILEFNEEGWFKYRTGPFSTYAEAKTEMKKLSKTDAFITGFSDGKRMGPKSDWAIRDEPSGMKILPAIVSPGGLRYFVQLLATREKSQTETLVKICPSCKNIMEFEEDGMYKYRVEAGSSFREAIRLRDQLGIPGAFIVSFNNGKKITLAESIQIEKQANK
ncbi:MAG: SPOR domain-containing protein [Bacteroidales bacterium]